MTLSGKGFRKVFSESPARLACVSDDPINRIHPVGKGHVG